MLQVELAADDYFLKSLFGVNIFILRTHFPIKILSNVSITKNSRIAAIAYEIAKLNMIFYLNMLAYPKYSYKLPTHTAH